MKAMIYLRAAPWDAQDFLVDTALSDETHFGAANDKKIAQLILGTYRLLGTLFFCHGAHLQSLLALCAAAAFCKKNKNHFDADTAHRYIELARACQFSISHFYTDDADQIKRYENELDTHNKTGFLMYDMVKNPNEYDQELIDHTAAKLIEVILRAHEEHRPEWNLWVKQCKAVADSKEFG